MLPSLSESYTVYTCKTIIATSSKGCKQRHHSMVSCQVGQQQVPRLFQDALELCIQRLTCLYRCFDIPVSSCIYGDADTVLFPFLGEDRICCQPHAVQGGEGSVWLILTPSSTLCRAAVLLILIRLNQYPAPSCPNPIITLQSRTALDWPVAMDLSKSRHLA